LCRSGCWPCCSCCALDPACSSWTIPKPYSSQAKGRDAIEQSWQATAACSRRWAKPDTRATCCWRSGNVVNLLRLLRGELCGLDLSRLALRQAYLAEVDAQDTRLVDAELAETVRLLERGAHMAGGLAGAG